MDFAGAIEELKQFIDARFAESDAKIDARFAESDAKIDARFAESEAKIDARFAEGEAKIDARFAESETRFDGKLDKLDKKIDVVQAELHELRHEMRDGFAGVGEAIEQIHEHLDRQDAWNEKTEGRLTRLEALVVAR